MNERVFRPGTLVAAAVAIGGAVLLVLPHHAWSVGRLVVLTIASGMALHALAVNAPPTWWLSPFDRPLTRTRGREGDETAWIRTTLSGRRQRITQGQALPPETLRQLQPLLRMTLARAGIDPDDVAARDRVLSPLAQAVLTAEPLRAPVWSRTVRADPAHTAALVQTLLDELERLADPTVPIPDLEPREGRAT